MDYQSYLQDAERDARELRARYLRDLTVRSALSLDLAIRRLACRVLLACR